MRAVIIVHYRNKNGQTSDWVCDYKRLDHILKVCEEKGLEVIGVEQL